MTNPSIRKKVESPNTGPKPRTPAEEVVTIPDLSPHFPASVLGGQIPGPYQREVSGTPDLVHPPSWVTDGSNPYSREES
jgi:hypothetical protein